MKTNTILIASAIVLAAIVISCSRSSREEAIDRVSDAAKALNGNPDDTPAVVKAQQKREKNRQNNEWTLENQRKHPREFCQAQLELLAKAKEQRSNSFFRSLRAEIELEGEIKKAQTSAQSLRAALSMAAAAYREADNAGTWPVTFNGLRLGKSDFQKRIRETERQYSQTTNGIPTLKKLLKDAMDSKMLAQEELGKIDHLRLKIESTIRTIELKHLVEADDAMANSLDSIRISIVALERFGDDMSDSSPLAVEAVGDDESSFNKILDSF